MSHDNWTAADEEMASADLEQQRMIFDALDNCYRAGAPLDDLRFLAWQAGCDRWCPKANVIRINAHR